MVIQQAIDNLKDKPKDDRKAVAGGIALAVVIALFFGWAFFFLKKIQSGAQSQQIGGGAQDEFNFSSVREAQKELMQGFSDTDELREVREQSGGQYQLDAPQQQVQESPGDQFGGSGSSD